MSTTEKPIFHETLDFDHLMQAARQHITTLAGNLWSDHNASDPGITQLEVLAFCIADLSYRTSFSVKDILTGYKGNLSEIHDLPLANIALPNHPVTVKDLRKVLIDMPHPAYLSSVQGGSHSARPYLTKLLVRNAFPIIAEHTEVDFYAVSKEYQNAFLTYNPTKSIKLQPIGLNKMAAAALPTAEEAEPYDNVDKSTVDEIILNGLYAIQIEFEDDIYYDENHQNVPHLYNLNQNYFKDQLTTTSGKQYDLSILMPYWDDINWSLKNVVPNTATLVYELRNTQPYFIAVDKLNYDDYFYDYYAEILLNQYKLPLFVKLETAVEDQITVHGITYFFKANFLDWNELSNGINIDDLNDVTHGLQQLDVEPGNRVLVRNVQVEGEDYLFDIQSRYGFNKIRISVDENNVVTTTSRYKTINLLTRIRFNKNTLIPSAHLIDVMAALKIKYNALFDERVALEQAVKSKLVDNQAVFYDTYHEKINRVFDHLFGGENCLWNYLGKYRNVCEDFSKFSASRVQEIALFGKLIVAPNHNINELLAEIYFRVDQFLSPLVKFNSLGEMVNKGYRFDELFNGPLLQNGFIEDADLDNLKRRSVVYTSDLIRIIMDVPGVLAVENFNISSYIDNRLMGRNVINCLNLTNSDIYKPRFSAEKTDLLVWVDGKQQEIQVDFIQEWYLEKLREAKSAQFSSPDNSALEIPTGTDRELANYDSIQHDFPEIYGIGEYGLPADATEERKARAKQLKAFLIPFEQLLANYLQQIANLPELFSYHRSIQSTYATQPLYNIPDVAPLFTGFVEDGVTWDAFKQDLNNAYQLGVKTGESTDEFLNRRNRFLSHLLSRFGESFEAYATQLFDANKHLLDEPSAGITAYRAARAGTLEKLITDKISFAEDYPKVSGERYKSFDMTAINRDRLLGTWNNSNIESYKLRLCRLLGIEQVNNAPIFQVAQNDDGAWIDVEGMHIIEHVLLRPRTTQAVLMGLDNHPHPSGIGTAIYEAEKDPYSFRITIVLPQNAGRFKNEKLRDFTERLIQLETPAHIRVNFKWMMGACGKKFESAYQDWKQNVYKLRPYFFQHLDSLAELDQTGLLIDPTGRRDDDTLTPIALEESPRKTIKISPQELDIIKDDLVPVDIDPRRLTILNLQDNLVRAMSSPCKLKLEVFNASHQVFQVVENQITFEHKKTDIFNINVSEIGGVVSFYRWNEVKNIMEKIVDFQPVVKPYFNITDFLKVKVGLTENYGGQGRYKMEYTFAESEPVSLSILVTKAIVPVNIWIGWQNGDLGELLSFNTETDGIYSISNVNWSTYYFDFNPPSTGEGIVKISSPSKGLVPTVLGTGKSVVYFKDLYMKFGAGNFHITYELDGQQSFADLNLFLELSIRVFNGKIELFPYQNQPIRIPAALNVIELFFEVPGGSLTVYDLSASQAKIDRVIEASDFVDYSDDLPYGTTVFYKKIDQLKIDRSTDTFYKDGHQYLFVYEHSGFQVRTTLHFDAPIKVPVDETNSEVLTVDEILVVDKETTLTITDSISKEKMKSVDQNYTLVYDYKNPAQFFNFKFNKGEGLLKLTAENGVVYERKSVENQLDFNGRDNLPKGLISGDYKAVYSPKSGLELTVSFNVINLNPTFSLSKISGKNPIYSAVGIPLYPHAQTYIWRINGTYISRAKNPTLALDFSKTEKIELELTMHLADHEASFKLVVTEESLIQLKG